MKLIWILVFLLSCQHQEPVELKTPLPAELVLCRIPASVMELCKKKAETVLPQILHGDYSVVDYRVLLGTTKRRYKRPIVEQVCVVTRANGSSESHRLPNLITCR